MLKRPSKDHFCVKDGPKNIFFTFFLKNTIERYLHLSDTVFLCRHYQGTEPRWPIRKFPFEQTLPLAEQLHLFLIKIIILNAVLTGQIWLLLLFLLKLTMSSPCPLHWPPEVNGGSLWSSSSLSSLQPRAETTRPRTSVGKRKSVTESANDFSQEVLLPPSSLPAKRK